MDKMKRKKEEEGVHVFIRRGENVRVFVLCLLWLFYCLYVVLCMRLPQYDHACPSLISFLQRCIYFGDRETICATRCSMYYSRFFVSKCVSPFWSHILSESRTKRLAIGKNSLMRGELLYSPVLRGRVVIFRMP